MLIRKRDGLAVISHWIYDRLNMLDGFDGVIRHWSQSTNAAPNSGGGAASKGLLQC